MDRKQRININNYVYKWVMVLGCTIYLEYNMSWKIHSFGTVVFFNCSLAKCWYDKLYRIRVFNGQNKNPEIEDKKLK